jgi:hypothetical protein
MNFRVAKIAIKVESTLPKQNDPKMECNNGQEIDLINS